MKHLLVIALILSLSAIMASCNKQASVPVEQLASKANKGKGKPSTEATTAQQTLSNPSPGTLQWTVPDLTGNEVYLGTYIQWGAAPMTSVDLIAGGFKIFKLAKPNTTPITSWTQGTDGWFIASGTWDIRVFGVIAEPNPLAGTMYLLGDTWVWQPDYINYREWDTNILIGVTF